MTVESVTVCKADVMMNGPNPDRKESTEETVPMLGDDSMFGSMQDPFGEIDEAMVETRETEKVGELYQESYGFGTSDVKLSENIEQQQLVAGSFVSSISQEENDATQDDDDAPFTAAHLAAETSSAVPSVLSPGANVKKQQVHERQKSDVEVAQGLFSGVRDDTRSFLPEIIPSSSSQQRYVNEESGVSIDGKVTEDASSFPVYSVKRYRGYFDVSTGDVLERMYRSTILFFKGDFLDYIGEKPDLYGPFWVASTLIFVSAAAGNTASYIAHHSKSKDADPSRWYYDVDKVGGSMALFYGYVGVIGLILYGILRYHGAGVPLASVWCAYGYALVAYIPMAALCVLPFEIARWLLIGAATLMSGMFLLMTFNTRVMDSVGIKASMVLLGMTVLHAILGLSLKFYFFNY